MRGNNGRRNGEGCDARIFIDPVHTVVETGRAPADDLLARYDGEWKQDINRVVTDLAFWGKGGLEGAGRGRRSSCGCVLIPSRHRMPGS